MEQTTYRIEQLGVMRFSWRWLTAFVAALLLAGVGVYGYVHELQHGMISSGMRSIGQGGATWGLYITFAVYFIGLSFGGACTAAAVRLLNLDAVKPLRRMAEVMTLVCLPLGAFCIVADLGRPVAGLLALPRYAQPMSPFFGTFTMVVAVYLFANLVYVFLDGRADAAACADRFPRWRWAYRIWASGWRGTAIERRRHEHAGYWLSVCLLPLEIVAMSTLGFVFGIQGGRPGWFSAVQAPSFIAIAASSGIAMFTLIVVIARRLNRLEEAISPDAIRVLGRFLWLVTIFYLYIMVVEILTATYAAGAADTRVAQAILWGPYAHLFWSSLACFVVPVVLLLPLFLFRNGSLGWLIIACIAINVGAILRRFLIVVPSQTHGQLLPYEVGSYVPTAPELMVVCGLFGVGTALYLLAWKLFPLLPIVATHRLPGERITPDPFPTRVLRAVATTTCIAVGAIFAVTGFLASARFGTLPYLDPAIPFSPMLFILGIMLLLYSVAAFETLPPRRK